MDYQIKARLLHIVYQKPCASRNTYGTKTFGESIKRDCFREGKITLVKNMEGEEVISTLTLYFDGQIDVGVQDEFIFNNKTYPLISFEHFDGLPGDPGKTVVYI